MKSDKQLFTSPQTHDGSQAVDLPLETSLQSGGRSETCTSIAKRTDSTRHVGSSGRGSGRSGSRRRAKKKSKTKRAGGWRKTASLEWHEVKSINHGLHVLAASGNATNVLVTISPSADIQDDAARKRLCYSLSARIGQYLRRHGHKFLALRVFEKAIGGKLHLHMLVVVPSDCVARLHGMADGSVIDMRKAAKCHPNYLTKNRRPLSPEFERIVGHRRKKGEAFKGRRWSFTQDAIQLITQWGHCA